jgi:hypothetical protein
MWGRLLNDKDDRTEACVVKTIPNRPIPIKSLCCVTTRELCTFKNTRLDGFFILLLFLLSLVSLALANLSLYPAL